MMELAKIEKIVSSNENAPMTKDALTIIDCHKKVLAHPKPRELERPIRSPLFFGSPEGGLFLEIGVGGAIAMVSVFANAPIMAFSALGLTFLTVIQYANGFSTVGCLAQNLWRKMGLPAKGADKIELEAKASQEKYRIEVELHEKVLAKQQKRAKPVLERMNKSAFSRSYSIGSEGLMVTEKKGLANIALMLEDLSVLNTPIPSVLAITKESE